MNKKMCFLIFAGFVIAVIAGFLFNISEIKIVTREVLDDMQNFYVCIFGILLGIFLYKNKYYWLLLIACSIVVALGINFFVKGSFGSNEAIAYRAGAVAAYGYLTALIRFMFI